MNPTKDREEYAAFVGLSTGHQKQIGHDTAVAFRHRLKKVMAREEGGKCAMPEEKIAADGKLAIHRKQTTYPP